MITWIVLFVAIFVVLFLTVLFTVGWVITSIFDCSLREGITLSPEIIGVICLVAVSALIAFALKVVIS